MNPDRDPDNSVIINLVHDIKNDKKHYNSVDEKWKYWASQQPDLFMRIPHLFYAAANPDIDFSPFEHMLHVKKQLENKEVTDSQAAEIVYKPLREKWFDPAIEIENNKKKQNK